ncbi:MAG: bifunctional adenosylcobinamide kinase/adenosylcobinamide-phosphate guanylyltransferase [Anaerolinea sp. 4484_236]|nr:MAG: bifunctional adenosylcobinamide kinase/adenosylcobinamide-phosphate guanylyltransferase [Anaerolinea sp. 4484_236]
MGQLTLLLGGARSGKSTLAEKMAKKRAQRILYIATAEALDDEMKMRIQKHRQQRPADWKTVEIPTGVGKALKVETPDADLILLDCLALLVSNVIMKSTKDFDHPDEEELQESVDAEIAALIRTIDSSPADWIIVSNEVGMGLVPTYPLGRVYRDLLGRANQRLASKAEESYLVVAGMALPLHEISI